MVAYSEIKLLIEVITLSKNRGIQIGYGRLKRENKKLKERIEKLKLENKKLKEDYSGRP